MGLRAGASMPPAPSGCRQLYAASRAIGRTWTVTATASPASRGRAAPGGHGGSGRGPEPIVFVRLGLVVFRVGPERGQLVEEPVVDRYRQDGAAGAGAAEHVARVDDALQDRPHHAGVVDVGNDADGHDCLRGRGGDGVCGMANGW